MGVTSIAFACGIIFFVEHLLQHVWMSISSTSLCKAFTRADPKSAKSCLQKVLELTVFFALLVSVRVKAARTMLVKLTLGVFSPSTPLYSSYIYVSQVPFFLLLYSVRIFEK